MKSSVTPNRGLVSTDSKDWDWVAAEAPCPCWAQCGQSGEFEIMSGPGGDEFEASGILFRDKWVLDGDTGLTMASGDLGCTD